MMIRVRATRCGIPGTRGHWPGCWGPPLGLSVPKTAWLEPGLPVVPKPKLDGKALMPYAYWTVAAIGFEGRALAVHLA
jgi:hypothetical protein